MLPFNRCLNPFIAMALAFSLYTPCYSSELYRWTDENGRLHISDSLENVPQEFRNQAESSRFDSDKSEKDSSSKNKPFDGALTPTHQPAVDNLNKKNQKTFEVPYTPYEGSAKRVIVPVMFNDSVTALMAIDTGAPGTLISVNLAKKLGLFDEEHGKLFISASGIGGTTQVIRSVIDTIQVGEARIKFVPTNITAKMSDSFDGLLGLDFVSNYSITIDPKRKVVIFEETPIDPDNPGGHDQEWWSSLFKEFAASRTKWKTISESLDKKIRESAVSGISELIAEKEFADYQYRESIKLFDKLHNYARENAVPMHWREY